MRIDPADIANYSTTNISESIGAGALWSYDSTAKKASLSIDGVNQISIDSNGVTITRNKFTEGETP